MPHFEPHHASTPIARHTISRRTLRSRAAISTAFLSQASHSRSLLSGVGTGAILCPHSCLSKTEKTPARFSLHLPCTYQTANAAHLQSLHEVLQFPCNRAGPLSHLRKHSSRAHSCPDRAAALQFCLSSSVLVTSRPRTRCKRRSPQSAATSSPPRGTDDRVERRKNLRQVFSSFPATVPAPHLHLALRIRFCLVQSIGSPNQPCASPTSPQVFLLPAPHCTLPTAPSHALHFLRRQGALVASFMQRYCRCAHEFLKHHIY